jgi:hypothetical protein
LECHFFFGDEHTHMYLGSLDVSNSVGIYSIGEKLKAWMSKTYVDSEIEYLNQQNEMSLFDFGTL